MRLTNRLRNTLWLSLAALSTVSCATQRAGTSSGRPVRQIVDARCTPLRAGLAGGFERADSLLALGEVELALERYRLLEVEAPDCGLISARTGDAHRLRGRAAAALDAYADAAALDACGSGVSGLAAVRLPTRVGTEARLEEILRELDALAACGELEVAALSVLWRVRLLLGRQEAAERALGELAGRLTPTEREYGINLIREAGARAVLITGSDVETDLALAAARTLGARAPIVVDLELLDHPEYIRERTRAGLDVGLTDEEIETLSPTRRDGRGWSVSDDVLDRILRVGGHASVSAATGGALRADPVRIVFSHHASSPSVYQLSSRLSLTGLVLVLDGALPGVDVAAIDAGVHRLELDAVATYRPPLGTAESFYWTTAAQRLFTGYVTSPLKGAVAAFQRGQHRAGRALLAFARARGLEIGLAHETLLRIDELERYASQ